MKKNIFIIIAFLSALATTPTPSLAVLESCANCDPNECTKTLNFTNPTYCTKQAITCLKDTCIKWCTECSSGYKLEQHIAQVEGCSNSPTVYSCVKENSGGGTDPGEDCDALCEACLPPFERPLWTNVENNPGYKSSTSTVCNESTNCKCVEQPTYGCANGYYGALPRCIKHVNSAIISCSGCTQCPKLGDVEAKTAIIPSISSPGGGETITDCFISANTEIKDSTGTYVFESRCNYKQ